MTVTSVDYVIVGQGLAGTTLAWCLMRRGYRVRVVDRRESVTASRIAAGLITPVTGRRLTLAWRFRELWEAAGAFYPSIESETHSRFFRPCRMVRLFASRHEADVLARRSGDLGELIERPDPPVNDDDCRHPFGGFQMPVAGQLDVARYIDVSRAAFEQSDSYCQADLDPKTDVELHDNEVWIPGLGIRASKVLFCQGFEAARNPWFEHVPFDSTKGEILTLRIPGFTEQRVVHRGVWLAPTGDGLFRAGSTYNWDRLDTVPTPEGRDSICGRLEEFLRRPFEVVDHSAAVRPIVVGRHPVIGLHPQHEQIGFFNGLGSKGSLQAPLFAEQFAGFLTGDNAIDPEVDLSRHAAARTTETTVRPVRLTDRAHEIVRETLQPGEMAIDATAGNGHDTLFLARQVGPGGHVYALDVQADAIDRTATRLADAGTRNVTLTCACHSELDVVVPRADHGRVGAVMFNLGYLPGGDKSITTRGETTVRAIRIAIRLLRDNGVITVLAYPGHPGGADETAEVARLMREQSLPFDVREVASDSDNPSAPQLLVLKKT